MKFSLSSSELADHIQVLGKVVATKNTISILDSFLLEITGDKLKITASDGENVMTTTVNVVEPTCDFRYALNAKTLIDAVKGIPEQPVTFEVDQNNYNTVIRYQNGYFSLIGRNADEYPSNEPLSSEKTTVSLPANMLCDAVNRALYAVDLTDSSHPVMHGVLFDVTEEGLFVVASDGRKLDYTKFAHANKEGTGQYVLASKAAQVLKTLLSRGKADASLTLTTEKAEVSVDEFCLTSRLIDGKFPAYEKVVPHNNPNHLVVNRMALMNLLRRVLVFSDEVNSLVKFHMEADQLVANVQNLDYSLSAEEKLMCEYDGIPMNIGFKGSNIVDFLGTIDSENIEFQIADQSRAVLILPSPQPNTVKDEDGNVPKDEEIIMLTMPSITND